MEVVVSNPHAKIHMKLVTPSNRTASSLSIHRGWFQAPYPPTKIHHARVPHTQVWTSWPSTDAQHCFSVESAGVRPGDTEGRLYMN